MTFDPYMQTNPWLQGLGGYGIPQTPYGVTQGLFGNLPLGIPPHLAAWGQGGLHGPTQQQFSPPSLFGGQMGSPLGQFGSPLAQLYSQLAPQTWLGGPQWVQSPIAQYLPQLALQALYGNLAPQLGQGPFGLGSGLGQQQPGFPGIPGQQPFGATPFGIPPYALFGRMPHIGGPYGGYPY